jgi:ATP-binding cassette subfamily B protein
LSAPGQLARALLRNPELLILDEATSSLDSLTERSITHTVQDIAATRPHLLTVLVAHRLSTVAHANAIYVLEKGKLVERGTHAELLAAGDHAERGGGLYAALWREQQATA